MSERKAQPEASFAAAGISGKEAARGVRVSRPGVGERRRMQISQINGADSLSLPRNLLDLRTRRRGRDFVYCA